MFYASPNTADFLNFGPKSFSKSAIRGTSGKLDSSPFLDFETIKAAGELYCQHQAKYLLAASILGATRSCSTL